MSSEFQQLAEERLEDANSLLSTGRYSCAYYISGYAVECAIKALIAGRTRRGEFPPKESAKFWVHNLKDLLVHAGVRNEFEDAKMADPELNAHWSVVNGWDEGSRYRPTSQQLAEAMVEAVQNPDHGVLQWLKERW